MWWVLLVCDQLVSRLACSGCWRNLGMKLICPALYVVVLLWLRLSNITLDYFLVAIGVA